MSEIFVVPKHAKFGEWIFAVDRNERISRELTFVLSNKSLYFDLTLNHTKIIVAVEHCTFALKCHICSIVHALHTVSQKKCYHLTT